MTREYDLPLTKSEVLILYRLLLAQDLLEKPTKAQWGKLLKITDKVEKVIYESEVPFPRKV